MLTVCDARVEAEKAGARPRFQSMEGADDVMLVYGDPRLQLVQRALTLTKTYDHILSTSLLPILHNLFHLLCFMSTACIWYTPAERQCNPRYGGNRGFIQKLPISSRILRADAFPLDIVAVV